MKKVKILKSFSALCGSYMAGEETELADADAKELSGCGYCDILVDLSPAIDAPKKAISHVKPKAKK